MNTLTIITVLIVTTGRSILKTKAEIFTALDHLSRALYAEQVAGQSLVKFIQSEREKLNQLEQIANSLLNHSQTALANPEGHLSNPVASFVLVKKLTSDWEINVEPLIRGPSMGALEAVEEIDVARSSFPSDDDLKGSAQALLRLQDTYALEAAVIARGDLPGVVDGVQLTAQDSLELARMAYINQDYYHTLIWADEARRLAELNPTSVAEKVDILDYLSYALYKQGNILTAAQYAQEILQEANVLDSTHERIAQNVRFFNGILEQRSIELGLTFEEMKSLEVPIRNEANLNDDYRSGGEFREYERLCRGQTVKEVPDGRLLGCRYVHHWDARLILMPAKEETLYFQPWVVLYHDLISDYEIDVIKKLSSPRLKRATVIDPETHEQIPAQYRVSKSAWLHDYEHPVVEKLSNRLNAVLRLDLSTVEELQLVNYGIGGHYEPHFDHADRDDEDEAFDTWRGNRIATLLFYLTDVEAGGGTVFVNLGIGAVPRKGTALFWFNLKKNGKGDELTRHAACPVLVGTKWVANKWFHTRGQEFIQPCSTDPKERFQLSDNPQTKRELLSLGREVVV